MMGINLTFLHALERQLTTRKLRYLLVGHPVCERVEGTSEVHPEEKSDTTIISWQKISQVFQTSLILD